ncbi:MAG: hypothetical protein BWY75_02316 [bacterium ADurb.Bin425]|nr:MAG: hypothetical protein BWY75_02316 [bacterium ADurb.Bin425]
MQQEKPPGLGLGKESQEISEGQAKKVIADKKLGDIIAGDILNHAPTAFDKPAIAIKKAQTKQIGAQGTIAGFKNATVPQAEKL